ncbi:MAG: hypothetical protein ACOYNC_07900 [Bacteroidales bacterium]
MNWKPRFSAPSRQFYTDGLLVFFSAIVLCYLAFYNGFPYFYSDTGTYLWSGFGTYRPVDRPLSYGIFLKHTSLSTSLWLPVLVQALSVSVLLYYCFKYLSGTAKYRIYYVVYIFLITFFTGVSINVGQLIPDVFAPVAILCMALFIFAPGMTLFETLLTSLLFILSISVHNSHFMITTLVLVLFLAGFIFKKSRHALQRARVKLLRVVYGLMLVVASYYIVCTIHYNGGVGYAVSKHGHVFFMARLFDCGILEQYLHDACPTHHYHLCDYQGKFPFDFIWDYEKSPLYQNGGWDGNRNEFNAIFRDIFTTPKYWPRLIARETEATIKQFFTFNTGDTNPQLEGSSSIAAMRANWPENTKEFFQSKQANRGLDWSMLNLFQTYLIAFLFFCSLIIYFMPGFDPNYKLYLTYFLVALLVNALVCGAISGVLDRYQSRVIWLLTLPFMLYLANREVTVKPLKKPFNASSRSET